jgi:hypothetical protein
MVLIYSRVHDKYKLKFSTLFKAVSIYQRYLDEDERVPFGLPELHVGVAALFLSMKYE